MFKSIVVTVCILISCFAVSHNLISQVVNIEKMRKQDEDGSKGNIGFGFFFIDNTKKIATFKNSIDFQYDHGPNTFILINDLNLMSVDKNNLVNAGFQHIRYNYTIKDSSFFTIEAFFQHQYNTIKLLKRRLLLGVGPRLRLLNTDRSRMYLGAISMYENEQLSDSSLTLKKLARLSSYFSFTCDILENLRINNITYYQPAFNNLGNFRISAESSIELKITNSLSFKVGLQLNYDSKPPENIQKLFYNWENELK